MRLSYSTLDILARDGDPTALNIMEAWQKYERPSQDPFAGNVSAFFNEATGYFLGLPNHTTKTRADIPAKMRVTCPPVLPRKTMTWDR